MGLGDIVTAAKTSASKGLNNSLGNASRRLRGAVGTDFGLGNAIGANGFPSDYSGLTEWFYNVLLTSTNSVPIQSLWLVYFDRIIPSNVDIKIYENNKNEWDLTNGNNNLTLGGSDKPGLIFAQAVKIPGDGINVSRSGPANAGIIKGLVGNGRKDPENLNISFLETNNSFTDLNLRPWAIKVGHKSLKYSSLKTNITVIQLAKAGPGKSLVEKAKWIFHDACPIDIDTQEYNYGADAITRRQVNFAYNYYTLSSKDNIGETSVLDFLLNKTGLDQYSPGNLIERAVETAVDLVTGAGERILTNVGGAVTDQIESVISRNQSSARSSAIGVEQSITEGTKKAIGNLTRTNDVPSRDNNLDKGKIAGAVSSQTGFADPNISDTPYGGKVIASNFIEVKIESTEQRIQRIRTPLTDIAVRNSSDTRSDIVVDTDDTPTFTSPGSDGGSNLTTTLAGGGKNAKSETKGDVDTPIFFPGDGGASNLQGKKSNKVSGSKLGAGGGGALDTPTFPPAAQDSVPGGQGDTVAGNQIRHKNVSIERNGPVGSRVPVNIVNINKNDTREQS